MKINCNQVDSHQIDKSINHFDRFFSICFPTKNKIKINIEIEIEID